MAGSMTSAHLCIPYSPIILNDLIDSVLPQGKGGNGLASYRAAQSTVHGSVPPVGSHQRCPPKQWLTGWKT